MNFKTNKIGKRKNIEKKQLAKPKKLASKHYTISIPLIASVIVILLLTMGIAKAIKSIDFSVLLSMAGNELSTDQYGHTNFLILGTGGKYHDGGNLTDTIMVASFDHKKKTMTMLSIPRDLYIYDEIIGNSKINEVYYYAKKHYDDDPIQGAEHMKTKVEEIINLPIHYWVKINFEGFTKLIDALGGVGIYVKESIYDPEYPLDGTYEFETFSIKKGEQTLSGKTALKYARSRKTTSDFDRADRQQQLIFAIKEKALQTDVILDGDKIRNILEVLSDNIETNITVKEILTLGSYAKDLSSESIQHYLLHDDSTQCGGFLYTPDRTLYNDLYVLITAGGKEFLHLYSNVLFTYPEVTIAPSNIQILNGTKKIGIAGETKQILKRLCLCEYDARYGNARSQDIIKTTYYYREKYDIDGNKVEYRPRSLDLLQSLIPGAESTIIPTEYSEYTAEIILEIGSDYTDSKNYIEDPFNYMYDIQRATEAETEIELITEITTE